jgi:hypothetical protein
MQRNEMIENTKVYETIFKRKSIREYDLTSPDERTLAEIMAHTGALKLTLKAQMSYIFAATWWIVDWNIQIL